MRVFLFQHAVFFCYICLLFFPFTVFPVTVMVCFLFLCFLQASGAVVTESQTYKKRADFLSNDDYAVYVRENVQVNVVWKAI